jgi:hypothetical protein
MQEKLVGASRSPSTSTATATNGSVRLSAPTVDARIPRGPRARRE